MRRTPCPPSGGRRRHGRSWLGEASAQEAQPHARFPYRFRTLRHRGRNRRAEDLYHATRAPARCRRSPSPPQGGCARARRRNAHRLPARMRRHAQQPFERPPPKTLRGQAAPAAPSWLARAPSRGVRSFAWLPDGRAPAPFYRREALRAGMRSASRGQSAREKVASPVERRCRIRCETSRRSRWPPSWRGSRRRSGVESRPPYFLPFGLAAGVIASASSGLRCGVGIPNASRTLASSSSRRSGLSLSVCLAASLPWPRRCSP